MLARDPAGAVDLRRRVTMVPSKHRRRVLSGPARPCEMITSVSPKLEDSVFLSACRRLPVPYTPVWFMRQAGRSLPEYREARGRTAMVEACTKPDLIAEITLQPLRRYHVDAAILFSDIVVPLRAAGIGIDIRSGIGPVVEQPIRAEQDLSRLRSLEPGDIHYVAEAVEILVGELGETPLIGFAGGPFTLASYLVEGGPSQELREDEGDDVRRPAAVECAAGPAGRHHHRRSCGSRWTAGASAVQLFDSWAGALSPEDYRRSRAAAQQAGPRRRWPGPACRGSTSASAPASCSA